MGVGNVLIVHMSYHTKAHSDTLRHIRTAVIAKGFKCQSIHRAKLNFRVTKNRDLIIVVGGDGTFLRTSHFVKDKTPLFGVNSDPTKKEGFFLRTNLKSFDKNLDVIIAGKAKLTEFSRVKAVLNGKEIPEFALNEFYIGHRKGYRMSEYEIKVGGRKESQKSSSVIVASGAGSMAWISSAGGPKMPVNAKKVEYLVREVYGGNLTGSRIRNGFLKPKQTVEMVSQMSGGIVIADGVGKEYPFKHGSKVKVGLAKPIYAYWF